MPAVGETSVEARVEASVKASRVEIASWAEVLIPPPVDASCSKRPQNITVILCKMLCREFIGSEKL